MKSQISGDTEFEAFFQQIEYVQEAVALQNPYKDIQIVTIAENLIESTGFYTTDFREWNRTDKAQKTWVNFKLHFFAGVSRKQGPVQASTTCRLWKIKHTKFVKRCHVCIDYARP